MNWLWPRQLHAETTALIRLGRVLHWTFVALAISAAIFTLPNEGIKMIPAALVLLTIGRGLRYILAGE